MKGFFCWWKFDLSRAYPSALFALQTAMQGPGHTREPSRNSPSDLEADGAKEKQPGGENPRYT